MHLVGFIVRILLNAADNKKWSVKRLIYVVECKIK